MASLSLSPTHAGAAWGAPGAAAAVAAVYNDASVQELRARVTPAVFQRINREIACYQSLRQVLDARIAGVKAKIETQRKFIKDNTSNEDSYFRTYKEFDCMPEHAELRDLEADSKDLAYRASLPVKAPEVPG